MTSSRTSNDPKDPPIAAGGGVRIPQVPTEDPFRTLDDLMAVVEALCPSWPERDPFVRAERMLL